MWRVRLTPLGFFAGLNGIRSFANSPRAFNLSMTYAWVFTVHGPGRAGPARALIAHARTRSGAHPRAMFTKCSLSVALNSA